MQHVDMNAVLKEISRQFRETGSWSISADRVRELLNLDTADFYQEIYSAARRPGGTVETRTTTQVFGPEEVGELVGLVELFAPRRVEAAFAELGAFVPQEDRVALTQTLLDTAADLAEEHRIDAESFRGMLRTLGNYEAARDRYFAEFFSREELIRRSACAFVEPRRYRVPELAAESARRVLDRLFRSRIVELESVLVRVGLELFEIACAAGYAERPEERRRREEEERRREEAHQGAEQSTASLEWACEVFGLTPRELKADTVRREYKKLMLRYHPDINPGGLRRAQHINQAYGLLMAATMQDGASMAPFRHD